MRQGVQLDVLGARGGELREEMLRKEPGLSDEFESRAELPRSQLVSHSKLVKSAAAKQARKCLNEENYN